MQSYRKDLMVPIVAFIYLKIPEAGLRMFMYEIIYLYTRNVLFFCTYDTEGNSSYLLILTSRRHFSMNLFQLI